MLKAAQPNFTEVWIKGKKREGGEPEQKNSLLKQDKQTLHDR